MLYGLYQSAQGAQAQSYRVDILANNLANAGTAGFKRDFALFQSNRPFDVENGTGSEPPGNQNALGGGVSTAKTVTDFSNGSLTHTGGPLDVAISGNAFFQVTNGSQTFLTRNGQFVLGRNGELTAQGSGMRVATANGGAITVPAEATRVEIAGDGSVSAMLPDGSQAQLGRLALVRPTSQDQLQKEGNSLYRPTGDVVPAGSDVQVKQGFFEASGVSPVSEMIDMIQASRAFEANINMIKFQDDSLERLLQSASAH